MVIDESQHVERREKTRKSEMADLARRAASDWGILPKEQYVISANFDTSHEPLRFSVLEI